eukprot:SAG31_NODE_3129_length_4646_cov_2.581262_2_plen_404_part_00
MRLELHVGRFGSQTWQYKAHCTELSQGNCPSFPNPIITQAEVTVEENVDYLLAVGTTGTPIGLIVGLLSTVVFVVTVVMTLLFCTSWGRACRQKCRWLPRDRETSALVFLSWARWCFVINLALLVTEPEASHHNDPKAASVNAVKEEIYKSFRTESKPLPTAKAAWEQEAEHSLSEESEVDSDEDIVTAAKKATALFNEEQERLKRELARKRAKGGRLRSRSYAPGKSSSWAGGNTSSDWNQRSRIRSSSTKVTTDDSDRVLDNQSLEKISSSRKRSHKSRSSSKGLKTGDEAGGPVLDSTPFAGGSKSSYLAKGSSASMPNLSSMSLAKIRSGSSRRRSSKRHAKREVDTEVEEDISGARRGASVGIGGGISYGSHLQMIMAAVQSHDITEEDDIASDPGTP